MTLMQIKVFLKTIETGSFTKAGRELHMTQPAVSQVIAGIEAELGIALIIRDRGKGFMLTDVGQKVLVHFREMMNQMEKIDQDIQAEKGIEAGKIRIGSIPSASAFFLPKIIRYFHENYPNIEFHLHEGTPEQVQEWLSSRYIDIALTDLPYPEMESVLLCRDKMNLLLWKDHPLNDKATVSIDHLDSQPLIISKGGYEVPIMDLFAKANARLNVAYEVDYVPTIVNMVQERLGLTILTDLMLSFLPDNTVIKELEPQMWRNIYLLCHSIESSSPAVQLFIRKIQEMLPYDFEINHETNVI